MDCGSYLNKKENKAFSVSQSVPVVVACLMFEKFGFQILLQAGCKSNVLKCLKRRLLSSFAEYKKRVEPCCMVICKTIQGPKTCASGQKKQAPDRARWGYLESRILFGVVCLLVPKQLDTALVQFKASKTSFPWSQATNLLGTSLGTHYGMGMWLPLCWV